MIDVTDDGRVRVLTLNRPERLNAFDVTLYDDAADALIAADADPGVAVVVLTGAGRAFSAGVDLGLMKERTSLRTSAGRHDFTGFVDALAAFRKPLLCAVNGLALGIGVTLLGYADLVFMSSEARIRLPFTALGVVPEAGSSYLLPRLAGRQNAAWALLSSEWLSAEQCAQMGIAWRLCPPDELLGTTMRHAQVLAAQPISSLIATKDTLVGPLREAVAGARDRENEHFARLLGGPANREALLAFAEKRAPDFSTVDGA